MFDLKPIFKK